MSRLQQLVNDYLPQLSAMLNKRIEHFEEKDRLNYQSMVFWAQNMPSPIRHSSPSNYRWRICSHVSE